MNELREIAAVPQQIISVRECKPIVSIVQDTALGVYRMTKGHVFMDDKQFFNLMARNTRFFGDLPRPAKTTDGGARVWSGRQVLSSIIPKNINLKSANKSYDDNKADGDKENYVVIENGEIVQGRIDTGIYSNRTRGLVHSIYSECGPEETRQFFDNTQTIICDYLVQSGFSVGISDLIVDEDTKNSLKQVIHNMKVKVYDVIRDIHTGRFENKSIETNNDYFEQQVNQLLNQANTSAGKLGMSKIDDNTNRMINMVKSGSKGNVINVAQMLACLGQQNVDGKRIVYGFDSRTLPHYTKYDDGPESRGFVENSFMKGLSPQEFFFHAMGGREGLIDTAVKSVTGDTPIVIIEDGKAKYVKIGDWIDAHLEKAKDKVMHYEERQMELLNIENQIYIPTTDYHGNVTWGPITAITRHDPGEELYEIKTRGGKKVIVTESKSLLIWKEDIKQFLEVNTPEIKIGDYVPVTANLSTPPVVVEYVDMKEFLPKTKYIYGTDFNKAVTAINASMEGKQRIPRGWWNANNESSFVLPYDKKARITRALWRSNTEVILDNYIYPYRGHREFCKIPDKFELTKYNGTFIGLFLAEGNACAKTGTISITNVDPNVKAFVKDWFNSVGITGTDYERVNKIGGISSSVIGSSRVLAAFLDKFVGNGARNKYVPDVAFVAPTEFVIGLLNGYFTGDGTVGKTNIDAGSASYRLTEGISMLCTRLGVFGKMFKTQLKSNNLGTKNIAPSHRLSIRGQWASKLSSKLDLLVEEKQKALKSLKPSDVHPNFKELNDVVLDTITEINIIGIEKYPKVYDLTIPTTLNFGLANGLQVRDTSSSGYLQRKLVKAMEDCKVAHDNTVRNASGAIVQFLYGEDGMDSIKIESQPVLTIDKDYDDLVKSYLITPEDDLTYLLDPDTIAEMQSVKDWDVQMREHFQQIITDREFIIEKIFKGKKDSSIMYPISFMRIINNAKAMFGKRGKTAMSDLNPMYVLRVVNQLCDELYVQKLSKGNKFLQILIRCYLSPKQMLINRFDKVVFDNIVDHIKAKFYDSLNSPSEMVGVCAAQSIGESVTQLSAHKDTVVRVKVVNRSTANSQFVKCTIGELIDGIHKTYPDRVLDVPGHHDSTAIPTSTLPNDYYIIGVSSDTEKTSWKKISEVSRHPANGNLIKVTTRSGKTTTATLSHSFLKRTETGIEPIKGSDLKIGHRIPVARFTPVVENPIMSYKDHVLDYNNGSLYNKPEGWMFGANLDFIKGFVDNYMKGRETVECASDAEADDMIVLLSYLGVFASKVNSVITLSMSEDKIPSVPGFVDDVERVEIYKKMEETNDPALRKLYEQIVESDLIWDEIINLEIIEDPKELVYDFTVPGNDSFAVDTGIIVHNTLNTFHQAGTSSASKAVRGVPRMEELLSVSRNQKTPTMIIHLSSSINQDKHKVKSVMNTIETTVFGDIVKSTRIYYDPDDFNTTIEADKDFVTSYRDFIGANILTAQPTSPWLLRFELDKDKMLDYNITMMDIHTVLQDQFDENVSVMFSDDNASQLIFRIKLASAQDNAKTKKKASAADADAAGASEERDYITELKALEKSMMENLIIKGYKNVSKAAMDKVDGMKYNRATMTFEKTHEWVINTAGTNLIDILGNPDVDPYRTVSNDITEIYDLFGIEAARQALYNEINSLLEDGNLYINYRHISLLVDTMTNRGYLLAINRHGINRVDIGPLAKCAFEEVTDMITKAGIFAEIDRVTGISANVMLGQVAPCGTGDSQILIDEEKLMKLATDEFVEAQDALPDFGAAPPHALAEEVCTLDNLTFDFTMPEPADAENIPKIVAPRIKLV